MDYNTSFFHESPAGGVPGKIVSLPANQTLPAQTATWKTKYAAVGVGVDQSVALFDGVNSEGLAGTCRCWWNAVGQVPSHWRSAI